MRRTVSLLLSFVMIFALVACGQPAVSERQDDIQPAAQKQKNSRKHLKTGQGQRRKRRKQKNSRMQKWKRNHLNPFRQENRRQMWI